MAVECRLIATPSASGVAFTLAVTNGGTDSVELTFRDAGRADFAVLAGDREVWRWSDGRMVAQVVESVTLAPGEDLSVDAAWPDPTPGEYTAIGELLARDRDCRARTEFQV